MPVNRVTFILIACICTWLAPLDYAATVIWDGGAGTSLWSDGNNWNPNGLPSSTADIQFTGTSSFSIDLNGDRTVNSLTFSGSSGYTLSNNTLTISSGSITVGTSTATHTIASNVTFSTGAAVAVGSGSTLALNGTVSGTTLTKSDTGTLRIGGTATFSGGTTISAGTLQIGNGGTTGSISGNIANSGTLVFQRIDAITYSGVISGTGAVTISSGAVTLTGDNTFSGTTTNAGILQIGNGGTSGSFAGDIVHNGSSLIFNRSNDLTYGGSISGTGALSKSGAGTLTLSGSNSYGGSTTVSAGTLQIGASGALPNTGVSVSSGATLTFAASLTYSGVISGAGSVILAGGLNLTLTGNNTQTGTLTVNSGGGTLEVGNGATSGSISSASVVNNSLLFFNRSDTVTFSGNISGAGLFDQVGTGTLILTGSNSLTSYVEGGGTLQIGNGGTSGSISGNLAVSAGNTLVFNRSDDLSYGAVISLSGAVTKQGAGTLTLTGNNTGTGTLTISTGGVSIGNGGTTGAWAGNIANSGTLTFNRSNSITYSGAISGSGSLTQAGTGTLILTGTNAPSGGTTVSAGTLQIGNGSTTGSLSGNITNNSAVTFNRSDLATYFGVISGTGSLTQAGASGLVLTGNNTYGGGTTISSGYIAIGNNGTTGSITGDVVNNGSLYFNRTDNITFAGNISGTGNVIKDSTTGTLTLTGTNTYSGGTNINLGTLQLGDGTTNGTITGDVVNDGTLTFRRITSSYDFNGNISGSGSLIQNSTATVRLGGTNTFSGGITITGSVLTIGTAGATGSITSNVLNNSILIFNRTTDYSYAGNISGSGSVFKVNSNTLTLSGTNTYANTTFLQGGLVNFTSLSNLGTGTLSFSGGGLQWASGTTTDISTRTVFFDTGGATLHTNGSSVTLANPIGNNGTGGLTKSGPGTLTLAGANTYTGATNVSAGTLVVSGSLSGSMNVNSTARVSGTVGGSVSVSNGSALLLTGSTGALNITGSLASFYPGLDTTGTPTSVGVGAVGGNVTFTSGPQFVIWLGVASSTDFSQLALHSAGTSLTLNSANFVLELGSAYQHVDGQTFLIVDGSGSNGISGQFSQGSTITGISVSSPGVTDQFTILYNVNSTGAASGQDIVLVAIPEPSSAVLLAAGAMLLGLSRRRKISAASAAR